MPALLLLPWRIQQEDPSLFLIKLNYCGTVRKKPKFLFSGSHKGLDLCSGHSIVTTTVTRCAGKQLDNTVVTLYQTSTGLRLYSKVSERFSPGQWVALTCPQKYNCGKTLIKWCSLLSSLKISTWKALWMLKTTEVMACAQGNGMSIIYTKVGVGVREDEKRETGVLTDSVTAVKPAWLLNNAARDLCSW